MAYAYNGGCVGVCPYIFACKPSYLSLSFIHPHPHFYLSLSLSHSLNQFVLKTLALGTIENNLKNGFSLFLSLFFNWERPEGVGVGGLSL